MTKRGRGRPSVYTPELAAELCERLASGETLIGICRDDHMPTETTVRDWATQDREGFSSRYAEARLAGYQRMAEELVEIADDGRNDWMERLDEEGKRAYVANGEHAARSRLRLDTRKWLLSKALPKIYGDKITHAGDPDQPLLGGSPVADLLAVLASINVRIEDKS